jgi:hypothetical protein
MANLHDTPRVALEALRGWLQTTGNTTYLLGLAQVFSEWAEAGQIRKYPTASLTEIEWTNDEASPTRVEDATPAAGTALLHFGTVSGKLQIDFWCNNRDQRQRIRQGMQRALHGDPSSPGLLITPDNYWGGTISYSYSAAQNRDTDEGIQRGEFRLMMIVEVEAPLLVEVPGVLTVTSMKLVASDDPSNTALQLDTVVP